MNTIWNDIKSNLKKEGNFTKLLYINIAIFLLFKTITVFGFLFNINDTNNFVESYLSLPSNLSDLVKKPWTIITYMFVHKDFFHLLFNMVWFHLGSKLFLQYFNGKQLISTYILGGIFGGLIYIIAFNSFPVFYDVVFNSKVMGASASVLAIFIAIASYTPNIHISFPFIGNIKLKHIAITLVVLDFLSISPENPGGHISHLGGALFGYVYILLLKKGTDLSINFHNLLSYFNFSKKPTLTRVHKKRRSRKTDDDYRNEKANRQEKINFILEKISKSGYDSLTKEEKELLFKESK